ncbi:conserved membrane hypothetical protein [Flavobacterium sp. 9AF]|uniref:hypothetical protein n=1 Tax=Flavobacterium sp. 9AF TaxID=2653142 RepID=UPI0012EFB007|nr:hypothetical protein [Flavobacterium sp. 9AF]VXB75778.1 conserved membrane hypothetical protein [Flavobacterium sp. 9AF]
MIVIAKYTVLLFGLFLIYASFFFFFKPFKAKEIIAKAGSTYFINYLELVTRLIIGLAFIISSEKSNFQIQFNIVGYFLVISALILMIVPIKKHNQFSRKAADKLKPIYLKISAPISLFLGILLLIAFKN